MFQGEFGEIGLDGINGEVVRVKDVQTDIVICLGLCVVVAFICLTSVFRD